MTVEAKRIPPIHQRNAGMGRRGAELSCSVAAMSLVCFGFSFAAPAGLHLSENRTVHSMASFWPWNVSLRDSPLRSCRIATSLFPAVASTRDTAISLGRWIQREYGSPGTPCDEPRNEFFAASHDTSR